MDVPLGESFRVVVNDEGQYSIWPMSLALPSGWTAAGFEGPRSDCLTHIASVWTDMRPKSLRSNPAAR